MGEIINFQEAKQALELNRVRERLQQRIAEEYTPRPPLKQAKIFSALPGEPLPADYPDLRPLLQRDGLILLSWAIWTRHEAYGRCFRVNWIKSYGKHRIYASNFVYESDLPSVVPARSGDPSWQKGIAGTSSYITDSNIADEAYLAAPDLNAMIIPPFIKLLRAAGVTVDFEYEFSLGKAREIEFRRETEKIVEQIQNLTPAQIAKS